MSFSFDLSKYIKKPKKTKAEAQKEIDIKDLPEELSNIQPYNKKDCFFYVYNNMVFNLHHLVVIPVIHKGKKCVICRHKDGLNHIIPKRIDELIDDQIEAILKQNKETTDNSYDKYVENKNSGGF